MAKLHFPEGFLWGAATSAHQVEGGNHNDWSEWEQKNAGRLAKEAAQKFGHLPNWESIQAEAENPKNYISGSAADHYNRFREDFDIAQSLNHNAHRFSIEWSRIEPEEGKFDEQAIEHYRDVLKALRERNIEPFVTLWHWTNPLWIRDIGDWSNKKTVFYFERYVEKLVTSFPEVTYWISMNEPNIHTSFAYIKGTQPPARKNTFTGLRVFRNILIAHKKAYSLIHKHHQTAQVGIANCVIHFEPKNNSFINNIAASVAHFFWNEYPFIFARKEMDFIGLNYYSRSFVGFGSQVKTTRQDCSDLGWEVFPEGLYTLLKKFSRFSLPMYITENGLADAVDSRRAKFIHGHLFWIHKAITEGAPVKGYLHWSFLDNHEFVEVRGFWPRFGLVEVDYETQERKIRPSAQVYAEICRDNALTLE